MFKFLFSAIAIIAIAYIGWLKFGPSLESDSKKVRVGMNANEVQEIMGHPTYIVPCGAISIDSVDDGPGFCNEEWLYGVRIYSVSSTLGQRVIDCTAEIELAMFNGKVLYKHTGIRGYQFPQPQ